MVYRAFFVTLISILTIGVSPVYLHDEIAFSSRLPDKKFFWSSAPSVVVCHHAPVSSESVRRALAWWSDLGYSFYGPYSSDFLRQKCFDPSPRGYILIMLVSGKNYSDKNIASTRIYSDKNTNEILWSIIELKNDMVVERVLEHELGHAIGWMHTRAVGHIMNDSLSRGGWVSAGLENTSGVIKNNKGFNYGYR